MKNKKRVVIAGFGDTGLIAGILLAKDYDVIGISSKPCLLSGQELGTRLTSPVQWQQNYLVDYSRYKKLDSVETIQAVIESLDPQRKVIAMRRPISGEDMSALGEPEELSYDALLIASGVSNGFWRNPDLQTRSEIEADIAAKAAQLAAADSLAVVGGGATGVGVAHAYKSRYPDKSVTLFYSRELPLPNYHAAARRDVVRRLQAVGVELCPEHRVALPEHFDPKQISNESLSFSSGQADFHADATLWALGMLKPNNQFIPAAMLDEQGYVKVDEYLQVPDHDGVFAVGDIAASDPLRSSARNWGFRFAAANIDAYLSAKPKRRRAYKASTYRWGSITGIDSNGLRVYQPDGKHFQFPSWSINTLLWPWFVRRGIYKGVRKPTDS